MNTEDSPSVEAPDLLPCPFCGDKLMQLVPIDGEPYFKHLLNACILATYGFGDPLVLLACDAKAWNQRPPVATVQEGAKVAELTDEEVQGDYRVIQFAQVLHANVPEEKRPQARSDFSDEQWGRLTAAFEFVIAADRELRGAGAPSAVGMTEELSPDFTDTARAALLWVLWHHQGASSNVGQPIRFALGMGQYEELNEHQLREAKRWAALRSSEATRVGEQGVPPNAAPLPLDALHRDVMNIPCNHGAGDIEASYASKVEAFRAGHKIARHDAAELVAACGVEGEQR